MTNQSMDKCKRNKQNAKCKKNAFGHYDCNMCLKCVILSRPVETGLRRCAEIIIKPIVWPLKKYCNQRSDGWFVLVQKKDFIFPPLMDVGAHFLCSLTSVILVILVQYYSQDFW